VEIEIVSIEKRPRFVSVGKTPMWVWIEYQLNGQAMRLDFADEGQTEQQIVELVKKDARRFAGVYSAKITV
jgi:hypothetical protein